jgi:hypothetical protein
MVQTNLLFLRRKLCYWCSSSLQIHRPRPGLNLLTRFWVQFPILYVLGQVFRSNFLQSSRQHLNLEGDCFLCVVGYYGSEWRRTALEGVADLWSNSCKPKSRRCLVSSVKRSEYMCVCVGGGGSASASEELACYWIFPITQSTCLQYWRHS